jgi:hypothetical protein
MLRVLEECDKVSSDVSADPVHDLRVALRRCRSMADGMMAMDPDRNWKAMKKAGKQLFQRLGALRDAQIMMEWIEKLKLTEISASTGRDETANAEIAPGVKLCADVPDVAVNPAHALLRLKSARGRTEAPAPPLKSSIANSGATGAARCRSVLRASVPAVRLCTLH